MKTWREAAGFPERHQLLREALRKTDGNQKEAALANMEKRPPVFRDAEA